MDECAQARGARPSFPPKLKLEALSFDVNGKLSVDTLDSEWHTSRLALPFSEKCLISLMDSRTPSEYHVIENETSCILEGALVYPYR